MFQTLSKTAKVANNWSQNRELALQGLGLI